MNHLKTFLIGLSATFFLIGLGILLYQYLDYIFLITFGLTLLMLIYTLGMLIKLLQEDFK